MSQRSMEMKVGGLILASVVLLVGFIVVMGGLSLQPSYRVYVDFENPGALQSGSPVRIAGVRVGRVTALEFRGGQKDEKGKPVLPIRVVADIDSVHQKAIHQ
ncbi:MAG TPA: MlaD family protein, partial [Polyangiaceae bacterium]|nr:MlaD family protein [Polyangiaceae bacterium]